MKHGFFSKRVISPYLFLLPSLLLIMIFRIIPIGYSFWLSLVKYNILMPQVSEFVGLKNYAKMINDEYIWKSLLNTVYYVVGSLSIGLLLSLLLSLIICESWFKLQGVVRSILFIPNLLSIAICGLIWSYIYQIDFGLLNTTLRSLGLPEQQLLASTKLAMWAIIIFSVWKGLGYNITIWSAAILSISKEYIEAARIDGANMIQEILFIKLPLLRPVANFLVVLGIIGSFQVFDAVYVMTGGGPARSTEVMVSYLWKTAFRDYNISYSAVIAWLLFAVIIIFAPLQLKIFKQEEVY